MVSGVCKCKQYAMAKRMQPEKDSTFELILQRGTAKHQSYDAKLFRVKVYQDSLKPLLQHKR